MFFQQHNSSLPVKPLCTCFWPFWFLAQTDHFGKAIAFPWAIAFARWPIFKIVSFLEYLFCFFFFFSGSLHRTTLVFLYNRFEHAFGHFNFATKLIILQSLQPLDGLYRLQDNRFLKSSHFSNIWCFFRRFFEKNNSTVLIDMFFAYF